MIRRGLLALTDYLVRKLHRKYTAIRNYKCPSCGYACTSTATLRGSGR